MIQIAHIVLHLAMALIVEQEPVELLCVIPLDKLCKFVAHEAELLAGVAHHEAVEHAQVAEFIVIFARHLVNEGALAVYHLVM